MAEQPNGKMDDLLKAYAEKRRRELDSPIELNAAARERLQAEVARSFAKPGVEGSFDWLLKWWPQLASGAVAVAAVVALTVVYTKTETAVSDKEALTQAAPAGRLAENKPTLQEKSLNNTLGVAVAQRAASEERGARIAAAPASPVANAPAMPTPVAVPQEAPVPAAAAQMASPSLNQAIQRQRFRNISPQQVAVDAMTASSAAEPPVAAQVPAKPSSVAMAKAPAAPATAAPSKSQVLSRRSQNMSQQQPFARRQLKNVNVTSLLDSFELESDGQNVVIREKDGSIYKGIVLPATVVAHAASGGAEVQSAEVKSKAENAVQAASYDFRAVGMNQSLRQNIVVTGRVSSATNLAVGVQTLRMADAADAKKSKDTSGAASQVTIEGKAVIDGVQEVPIQAVSEP